LLELLDQIEAGRAALAAAGVDVRAEEGRLAAVHGALQKKKSLLLRELRPLGGLAAQRAGRPLTPAQWWWFLDQTLAAERRRAARRYLLFAGLLLALAAAAVLLYRRFLQPDPTTLTVYRNQIDIQRLMAARDFAAAVPLLEQNVALAPADAEWPIRLGVARELMGDASAGAALFDAGRRLAASELAFHLQRAQVYIEVGEFAAGRADALRATELEGQSALAFYTLGRALAGLGERAAALAAYERASQLAQNAPGSETLYVMARLEIAQLLQAPALPAGATPTPTP